MGDKKDPGKFTIRFNVADPQQQAVADLLNRQGRCKAQFITNAVMLYVHAAPVPLPGSTVIQYAATEHQKDRNPATAAETANGQNIAEENGIADTDMDTILRTMDAFHNSGA